MGGAPQNKALKEILANAKRNEQGLKIVYQGNTIFELHQITYFNEWYGLLYLYEHKYNPVFLNTTEVRSVDASGSVVIINLKQFPSS